MFRGHHHLRRIASVSAFGIGVAFLAPAARAQSGGPIRPRHPVTNGTVTSFDVRGFTVGNAGRLEIKGTGPCRVRADILDMSIREPASHPVFTKLFEPAQLPLTIEHIGPLAPGSYRAYLIGYDKELCLVQGPDHAAGGWYVDFRVPAAAIASRDGQATPKAPSDPKTPAGGGPVSGNFATANGQLATLSVPGGSFAEDETQKLLVTGKGGCEFDLAISNKSYGGAYDKTNAVAPMKLDGGATLYNGTHFGTLAEGSYHATATGKNGCTGVASIDFKVTAKTSVKKVSGKPTISFDQQPKSGGTFVRTKDGSIWFKITLPSSIKDEPSAGCCDVEFDFQNAYGGWEPLPNSPFTDAGFGAAIKGQAGISSKSISGFNSGTVWRVKVRAYKYKTEFEWSDWLEFRVDQN